MKVIHLGPDRRNDWNSFVAGEPYFSLLQAWEWGEFKEKLGWKAHRIAVENDGKIKAAAQLLIKCFMSRTAAIGYVARGPVGNWKDPDIAPLLFEELTQTAKRNRAIFLRIEPYLLHNPQNAVFFKSLGFHQSQNTIQPQATIIIDLDKDLDNIQKSFRRKTRQYINQALRGGITVRVGGSEDLPAYYNLIRETCRREDFPSRIRAYYENELRCLAAADLAVMLMAFHQGRLLAVRTVCRFGRHAAEFHAGSTPPTPHLYPNHLLVWEAIKWAKSQECCSYDLWGIPEEIGQRAADEVELPDVDRTDGLWGVYRFKSGFGRNVVFLAGAYDYIYRPRLYALMSDRMKNLTTFERVKSFLDFFRHP